MSPVGHHPALPCHARFSTRSVTCLAGWPLRMRPSTLGRCPVASFGSVIVGRGGLENGMLKIAVPAKSDRHQPSRKPARVQSPDLSVDHRVSVNPCCLAVLAARTRGTPWKVLQPRLLSLGGLVSMLRVEVAATTSTGIGSIQSRAAQRPGSISSLTKHANTNNDGWRMPSH